MSQSRVTIVSIGAGPAATMLLERVVASRPELAADTALQVHLIDPHEPGGGRIWRRGQSPLLKLNSMLEDVAFFTDPSCVLDGPVHPGYSLAEWVVAVRDGAAARSTEWDAALRHEIDTIGPRDFPTRRLANAYLSWSLGEVLRRGGGDVDVQWHPDRAVAVRDASDAHEVELASGRTISADVVVYALGHNGTDPAPESVRLAAFAERNGLGYVAPDFTADLDLDWIPAGEPVIVRGMGLAATDLVVLLTEGRGGRFEANTIADGGGLRYHPSGREPLLYLGSRRGVPYRSKITSRLAGDPVELEYLGAEWHEALAASTEPLDFATDVWPLLVAELTTGYYRELSTAHPERVTVPWAEFAQELREVFARQPGAAADAALITLIERRVPAQLDRFTIADFDRPFAAAAGHIPVAERPLDPDRVHAAISTHVAADLLQRTSQEHSATQGLFLTALFSYLSLAEVAPERWNAHSRTQALPGRWHSFFSYLASGPPGHRLEELLALAAAGVVRFIGADVEVSADETGGVFRAVGGVAGVHVDGDPVGSVVTARTLVDAWLPEARAASSDNTLLRELVAGGQLRELAVAVAASDPAAVQRLGTLTTGRVEVGGDGRVPGSATEFALGPFTATPTAGAFTRPGLNSLPFRVHDRCARAILTTVAQIAAARTAGSDSAAAQQEPVMQAG